MPPGLSLTKEITDSEERELQREYRDLVRKAMANAADPDSTDYCVWNKSDTYLLQDQPIVDAAFYASAILKARASFGRCSRKKQRTTF